MRRSPLLLLVCGLALATAVACLRVAAFVVPPALPAPPPDRVAAAQVALVHRFYTAVNASLRTGDPTALDALVAEDLIEYPATAGDAAGRAGLVQHLLALRAIFPDLQLIIDDLQATTAGQVTARVQTTGAEQGHFLGLSLPAGVTVWPPLEAVRVEADQIVERWGRAEAPVRLAPLFQTKRPAPPTGTAYLQVARVTYPPASAVPLWGEPELRLTYLEAGTLTVPTHIRWTGANADAWTAAAGTLLAAEPGLVARASDDDAAIVLEVTILSGPPDPTQPIPERAVNVEATVLATAVVAVPDWEEMSVAVGRVTLGPGATLAFPQATGSVLLVVERGELELTADAGRVAGSGSWVADGGANRSSDGWAVAGPNQMPLPAGRMAVVETRARSLWHNPGSQPTAVLVLVIAPSGEEPAEFPATPTLASTPNRSGGEGGRQ